LKTKSFSEMQCSIARTLEHVGSWWSLLIIRDAMMGAKRFKHFEASLGIAKNTLTSRLNELVESGILQRRKASDGSAYEEYVLSQKGRELAPVMMALAQWGDKWAVHPDGPPHQFIDRNAGTPIGRIWPRHEDGRLMQLDEVGVKDLTTNSDVKGAAFGE